MDGIKDIAKVIALSSVDNINNFAGVKRIHAVMHRGEIGCGIQKSAVGFANKKRAFAIGKLNNHCALIHLRKTGINEGLNRWRKFVAIKTFAARMFVGQVNAKNARGFQNFGHGDVNQLLPLGNCGSVASL